MIKSIRTMLRESKERYTVPRRVQDVIPVRRIWNDGIFMVGGRFAKTYQFSDINYMVASRDDKESILMPLRGDGRDVYRREYNQMLLDKATGANSIFQEKYITVTVTKKDVKEARSYFTRVGADLTSHFAALGSKCVELTATNRLRILHDFYRAGEEGSFHFDARDMMRKDHDFRDDICPDSMVTEQIDFNRNMMFIVIIIMCDKENLLNHSAFLLGVPGSGKSFSAKELIAFLMLNTDDDILICDPEGVN